MYSTNTLILFDLVVEKSIVKRVSVFLIVRKKEIP